MGFFSKVWKGLKKGVKKVARGIKKVVKKVGRAVGKLGIVGQIGMMFLMPYAMGALGGMFGATGTLSSWSATLLGPQAGVFSKALGHTLNLINTAGTAVGNVYNSVSSTISGALDKTGNFLKGRGFVATDPTNLISTIPTDSSIIPTDPSKLAVEASSKIGVLDTGEILGLKTPTPTLGGDAISSIASGTDALSQQVTQQVGTEVVKEEAQKGLLSKTVDKIKADIKDFDAYDYTKKLATGTIESSVVGGAKQALAQKTAKAFGYEQPEGSDFYSFNMESLLDASRSNPAVFDTVDFLANNSGNAYYGNAVRNNPYMTKLLSDGTSAYDSYMSQFQNQLIRG